MDVEGEERAAAASPPTPQVRTSKARRTQIANEERALALELRMWEPGVPAAEPPDAHRQTAAALSRKRARDSAGEAGGLERNAPRDPGEALAERLEAELRHEGRSLLDECRAGKGPGAAERSTPARRKFTHPLDKRPEEVALWIDDEVHGSLSQLARLNLGVPEDTWARAAWRAAMAMEHSVLSMPIRNRRRLYTLMRHITDPRSATVLPDGEPSQVPASHECDGDASGSFMDVAASTADHLVPELGMTLGQLSVFHILHARTQYVKHRDLGEHVQAAELMQPHAHARPIAIETTFS
jgi:hypothetical protein